MANHTKRTLSAEELDQLAMELDAVRARAMADVGEKDARYIRRVVALVRYSAFAGRALLMLSFFPPAWVLGTLLLALSKIVENMEVAHNVMHGQYDWMGDPSLNGQTYEWDLVGTSDNWRTSHNFMHHTYTNIKGMDDDVGYGVLRLFPEQRWKPHYLLQPVYAVIFALLFQWGIAIQELELGRLASGRMTVDEVRPQLQRTGRKIVAQVTKDYLAWPLLGVVLTLPFALMGQGPALSDVFFTVLIANAIANVLRNLWTYMIIFCGHFPADVHVFTKAQVEGETRARWYVRQLLGSCNIGGGKLFHVLSGNLSHQIEHHIFPDLPSNRYPELAPRVRALADRYGLPYNTGALSRQFGTTVWKILRLAFPGGAALGAAKA